MLKRDLRRILLLKRKNINLNREELYEKLFGLPEFVSAATVLCYVSKQYEIDTIPVIKTAFSSGKLVAVPKVCQKEIRFYFIDDLSTLQIGSFGVLEPSAASQTNICSSFKNSVCIVPALACNKDGFRLGYGGGYYDRFLARYDGTSIALCGFTADFQQEKHDVKTDYVIVV
jgi:5-formyltetrahydrofolate cyclo-ligase